MIQNNKWRPLRSLVEQALGDGLWQRITAVRQHQNATLVFELWDEAVVQQQDAIAHHYWLWLSKYYNLTTAELTDINQTG